MKGWFCAEFGVKGKAVLHHHTVVLRGHVSDQMYPHTAAVHSSHENDKKLAVYPPSSFPPLACKGPRNQRTNELVWYIEMVLPVAIFEVVLRPAVSIPARRISLLLLDGQQPSFAVSVVLWESPKLTTKICRTRQEAHDSTHTTVLSVHRSKHSPRRLLPLVPSWWSWPGVKERQWTWLRRASASNSNSRARVRQR